MDRDVMTRYFEMAREQAHALLNDVETERFCEMPYEGAKHAGWVMTHLTLAAGMTAGLLDESDEPDQYAGVPKSWADVGSPSAAITDVREDYPSKNELLEEYDRVHALANKRLAAVNDDHLAKPHPTEDYRSFWPTIGDAALYLMTQHEQYHLGQMQQWRRALGMGPHA